MLGKEQLASHAWSPACLDTKTPPKSSKISLFLVHLIPPFTQSAFRFTQSPNTFDPSDNNTKHANALDQVTAQPSRGVSIPGYLSVDVDDGVTLCGQINIVLVYLYNYNIYIVYLLIYLQDIHIYIYIYNRYIIYI